MNTFTVALMLSLVLTTLGMVVDSPQETGAAANVLEREANMEGEGGNVDYFLLDFIIVEKIPFKYGIYAC
uniref:Putative secreted protein n=1 Tax=Ixodes ricinus TaxID=34613 RepID=A0A147BX01_IXORI